MSCGVRSQGVGKWEAPATRRCSALPIKYHRGTSHPVLLVFLPAASFPGVGPVIYSSAHFVALKPLRAPLAAARYYDDARASVSPVHALTGDGRSTQMRRLLYARAPCLINGG